MDCTGGRKAQPDHITVRDRLLSVPGYMCVELRRNQKRKN